MFARLKFPLVTQYGSQQTGYHIVSLFPKQTVMTLCRNWVVLHAHSADMLMCIAGLSE